MVLLHPFLLTGFMMGVLFLVAIMFCWASVIIDQGRWMGLRETLSYLYFKWEIETGLSLLISYMGMGATVVLGLITLRFSFKTEEHARIKGLQNIKIKSVHFFDIYEDFVPSKWRYSDARESQFLLEIRLSKGSSDYMLQINKVYWAGCEEGYTYGVWQELNQCKVYIENAANTIIYVYFNEFEAVQNKQLEEDDKGNSITFFHHIEDYEPLLFDKSVRHRWIQLDMKVSEKVWVKKQVPKAFRAEMDILVENRCDRNPQKDWIKLYEIRHDIKIDNTKEKSR